MWRQALGSRDGAEQEEGREAAVWDGQDDGRDHQQVLDQCEKREHAQLVACNDIRAMVRAIAAHGDIKIHDATRWRQCVE